MVFYAVKLNGQPKIEFALALDVTYTGSERNIIDHRTEILELSVYSGFGYQYSTEDGAFTAPEGTVVALVPLHRYDVVPILPETGGASCTGTTCSIAVRAEGMEVAEYDISDHAAIGEILDAAENDVFFIARGTELPAEELQTVLALFRSVIARYSAGTANGRLLAISGWYELAALLDGAFRREVWAGAQEDAAHSANFYVRKAKKYISLHEKEALTLSGLAAELGISAGYLCTVFRRTTGMTVVSYINRMRLRRLYELIGTERDRALSALCGEVGFHDIRYAQRLFRKTYGISMQRCRQQNKGISLYHENPWKVPDLDHDIYRDEEENAVKGETEEKQKKGLP